MQRAIHNAIRTVLTSSQSQRKIVIVGCWFHLKSAVIKWIEKYKTQIKDNDDWKEELWIDLEVLVTTVVVDWKDETTKFIGKWITRDNCFINYFNDTYLKDSAMFPILLGPNIFPNQVI